MTPEKFMEKMSLECKKRSGMTFRFSKTQYRKFKVFFIKQGKKHMRWNIERATDEFNAMCKAFNITLL